SETKRLGLQFDFTLGSGWPYGGPFIPGRLAAQKITVLSRDAQGPGEFVWRLYPYLTGGGRAFAAVASPVLDSGSLDLSRSKIIRMARVRGGGIRWTVPSGQWRILVFLDELTSQLVKRATVGMEGYVIDHFDNRALDLFLDAVGNRTIEELRAIADPPFYSVFCDSLEVYGADWTPHFLKEFQRRRGYDLEPYLPALWEEAGEPTPHVRYDYHLTLSDLMMENFFGHLDAWSHKHGMTARVQAHGAMGDVMRGYGLADIPEGEEGAHADRYAVIIDHRRLASSAGHIYLKPVISCESYTWLWFPLFTVTLEMMKGATDSSFLDGINQIVNQGYSYSSPQVGEPGWVFYAATMVNHNNIWWRHYKYLAAYIQRAAAVLQKGVSLNPIAVYVPLADIYSHYGLGSLTMDTEIQRRLGLGLFMDLRRAGYDFDLINDDALQRIARVEGGKLRAGSAVYSAIIVPGVRYMPPESIEPLAEFVRQGGLLIFMDRLPERAPGLKHQEARTAQLRAALADLWGSNRPALESMRTVGNGKVVLTAGQDGTLAHLKAEIPPDFTIVEAGDQSAAAIQQAADNVGFLHRRAGETDLYFISNISRFVQNLRVRFNAGHQVPQRWNPETGELEQSLAFDYVEHAQGKATEVQLHLDPLDSCFIVFGGPGRPLLTRTNCWGPIRIKNNSGTVRVSGAVEENGEYSFTDSSGKKHRLFVRGVPQPISIKGPWNLALGEQKALSLERLQSWTDLPAGENYSGWGRYESSVEVESLGEDIEWILDLGEVHETAEAWLNGVDLGAAWKGLRRLPCKNALKKGVNHLRVEVGNLWIQKMEFLPKPNYKAVAETFGIRWGLYGESKVEQLPPSGLIGPVRLTARKRFEAPWGSTDS
ncbi:MAG: glycosyl hydrolase, partial [Terriglobia bacterium]